LQIEYFTNAIRIDIEYAGTYNNRGVAYYMKGEYDRAIRDYNKAIESNPDYAKAYNGRGVAYEKKGEHDRAIKDYSNPNLTVTAENAHQ